MSQNLVVVEKCEAVVAFKKDESILLTLGSQIKALEETYRAELIHVNTPAEAPPELPRILLSFGDFLVNIGLNRFQILVESTEHTNATYDKMVLYVRETILPIVNKLLAENVEYEWVGLVSTINFQDRSQEKITSLEAISPVFRQLINLDWNDKDLSSFNLRLGYKKSGYFYNYTIHGYDKKDVVLPLSGQKGTSPIQVDVSKLPIKESGVRLILDTNNKQLEEKTSAIADFDKILQKQQDAFDNFLSDFNLRTVL